MRLTPSRALGPVGIWTALLREAPAVGFDAAALRDAVAEVEALGYGTVWLGGNSSVGEAAALLAASRDLTVANGILSIWEHAPGAVAEQTAEANAAYDDRFLLGVGTSHSAIVPAYAKPYSAMRSYLDDLDTADRPVGRDERVLAALGPKMVRLAADRSAGAHPYLVTAEQVAELRADLGPDPVLAPELMVVLDPDLDRARATARASIGGYLSLPNYTRNMLRGGFTEDDLADGGSDRLIDALAAVGGLETARDRIAAFHSAGADHVAVQILSDRPGPPMAEWRELAAALDLSGTAH